MVSNIYDLNIVNKTFNEIAVDLKLENVQGEIKLVGKEIIMKPQEIIDAKFLVLLSKNDLSKMNTPLEIGIYDNDKLITKITTSFLAPMKKKENIDDEN